MWRLRDPCAWAECAEFVELRDLCAWAECAEYEGVTTIHFPVVLSSKFNNIYKHNSNMLILFRVFCLSPLAKCAFLPFAAAC